MPQLFRKLSLAHGQTILMLYHLSTKKFSFSIASRDNFNFINILTHIHLSIFLIVPLFSHATPPCCPTLLFCSPRSTPLSGTRIIYCLDKGFIAFMLSSTNNFVFNLNTQYPHFVLEYFHKCKNRFGNVPRETIFHAIPLLKRGTFFRSSPLHR